MAASQGGGGGASQPPGKVPPNPQLTPCMWCRTPLSHPAAPFCNACARPQKKCIICSNPIPPHQLCPYCHAPQHETKMCLNPQCNKPLSVPGVAFCTICGAPQDPAMLQQFLTAGHCISCSTQLFTPTQRICHICGTPQHSQTSMEYSGQSMTHSPQPPLNVSQSRLQPSPKLTQSPFHQHPQFSAPPNMGLSSFLSPGYSEQHASHEQQSTKRSPKGDGHVANKRNRTKKTSQNSQTILLSGAVVRQQVQQTHFTSPPTAASAQVTPQPGNHPSTQGTITPSHKKKEKNRPMTGVSRSSTEKSDPIAHLKPRTGCLPPSLDPPKDQSITIHFNAILPMEAWEWDDDSSVYIRFMLGDNVPDIGPGKIVRTTEDGLAVVEFVVPMQVDCRDGIFYKYVVFSRRMEEVGHPYEYLHGAPHVNEHTNRALTVPKKKRTPGVIIRQFDTMIYPEYKDKFGRGFALYLQGFVYSTGPETVHPRFSVPPSDKMRAQCLRIHLDPYKKQLLEGEFQANFDIHSAVEQFSDLYNCCFQQHYGTSLFFDWEMFSLRNIIIEWLQNLIQQLDQSSLNHTSKLVTAVVVMCCAYCLCGDHIADSASVALLKMMAMLPNGEAFRFLGSLMKAKESRPLVTKALSVLFNRIVKRNKFKVDYTIHLLKALPLLHLLRGDCGPHERIIVRPSAIKWMDPVIDLQPVRYRMEQRKGFMNKYFQELQDLFSLDNLLLFDIAYICPKSDIADLCDAIHLPYAIALVCQKINSTYSDENDVDNVICRPLGVLQQRVNEVQSFQMEELDHCLEAAHFVLETVEQRLTGISINEQRSLKSSVALLLCLTARLDTVQSSPSSTDIKQMREKALEGIHKLLNDWIRREGVIGPHFGNIYGQKLTYSCKHEQELKIWQHLLELSCPPSVEQDWHGVVKAIVTNRVKLVAPAARVDLFLELESHDNIPAIITNIFMTEATAALDVLVLRKQIHSMYSTRSGYTSYNFEKFSKTQSERVVALLGTTLMKKYPNFEKDQSLLLTELLEWDLWPAYISVFAQRHLIAFTEGGTTTCTWVFICMCAVSILEDICARICSGNVCIEELRYLKSKKAQMNKLCSEATVDGKVQFNLPSGSTVVAQLEQRLKEYEQFEEYRQHLSYLMSQLNSVRLQGTDKLVQDLHNDFNRCDVNKLCTSVDQQCVVQCFPDAVPLESFMSNFWTMTQVCSSKIFLDLWHDRAALVTNRSASLTLSEVEKELWTPVFSQCVELLAKLKDYSLSLQVVDQLFKGQTDIPGNIKQLYRGVEMCQNSRDVKNFKWMKGVIVRMNQFWMLCNFAKTAEAFLQIRDALKLTGDFELVERIASQANTSMKDHTLQAIDKSVVKAAKFLEDFANDPKKSECLRAYSESQSIVKWIRKETKDVNDLQNFVNISLATAAGGEDAYTRDRLSNLRTVGSGFGALIYRLPPNAGYETLVDRCKSLWDTLRSAPNLPYMMRDCDKTIDWYQSVKETQGSVEVTSYGQMNNINRYGSYTIGSGRKNVHTSQSQVIRLTLSGSEKRLPKNNYSLDDLSDLGSKLVLITGRESSEIKDDEVFLHSLVCVRRIADALMALQQYGSGDYIGWEMSFPCALPNVVEELQKVASKMEDDLDKWKQEIQEKRDEFYELNYYTTQQLLLLREELGRLKEPGEDQVKPHAMALLQSISREVSADAMKRYVQEVVTILEQQRAMTSTEAKAERKKVKVPVSSSSQLSGQEAAAPTLPPPATEASSAFMTGLLESEGVKTSAPLAQTQENELTNDRRAILVNLKENFGFHRQLILLAFERCDNPGDKNEVSRWCLDNQDNFKYKEEEPMEEEKEETQEWMSMLSDKEEDGEVMELPSRAAAVLDGPGLYVGSSTVTNLEIAKYQTKAYLTLLELGMVLGVVRDDYPSPVLSKRPFSDKVLKIGEPNLVVTPPDNVIKTTLALYMEGGDQSLPMPTYEEVLVCSERTTDEEVTLLWKRAINDPSNFRLFCLVHAERLSYQVCDRALWSLNQLSQGQKDYRIIIICSSEEEEKSHVISKLQLFRRPFSALQPNTSFADYLLRHFRRWPEAFYQRALSRAVVASVVDPDKSYVRVVTSQRAGMGKSLYIKRRREALKAATTHGPHEVIVPIHGPVVTADTVVGALKKHIGKSRPIIFHLDIAPNVLWQVDSILFCLLVLQGLCDSQGNVWRCHPAHLYMIESTVPKGGEGRAASRTTTLFKLLPSVECVSPRHLNAVQLQPNCVPMDEAEFCSHTYQRVYQYLRRHIAQISLDSFSYQPGSVEGSTADCLQILLSECGVKNPSWLELSHFIKFLDIQLSSCENSVFCNEDHVGDVMPGMRSFVVEFMIRMSKDFAISSIRDIEEEEDEEEVETLGEYTILKRKKWEKSFHPYLFFNRDCSTMTFVGFNTNKNGDLIDPVKNTRIKGLERAISYQLEAGLIQNQVNLSENYQLWNKMTMLQKMSLVMGLEYVTDPDSSYVLTVDNVIKILAIQMRFRCNIPVVVMGETGCGKTRLIRFMCDMIALSAGGGIDSVRNLLIMKVHGGTTEQDVRNKVLEAEELAKINKGKGIDTILFFDEANTTEAIGLIKEVMCDRRVYGREISRDVNFIAACNPYRKHTDEMIGKLESAGLGFYVKITEPQQKMGKIPLRQLVYRVLELPPSMRPLVYDFGQLTNTTEQDYTGQIVINHCSETLSQQVITAVSRVLAWCQKFMRERKDECSFVSLRDVERAMVVFKFFIEKMSLFKDLIAAKAKDEDDKTPLQDTPTWALMLALSICYHPRLQDRNDFEYRVVQQFSPPLALTGGVQQFKDEIRWCQEVLLENMLLGRNIAKNAALRENVFMMTISIELRIPLFLVGKPGSSKSLAKSIIADSMHGRASEKELLKHFKEVHMFSYQCSQLSTPESVIEMFNTAKGFQEKQDTSKFVSIVVLDKIGLAEDSPNLPLKALHPLLEDGTEGADDSKQIVAREKRVAFIGISNWALDPAKMNRGVMVTRGDPDRMELELSAWGICSDEENDPVKKRLDRFFAPLADSYIEICRQQERQYFGLRDFYSLVKMLYWMCEKTQSDPTNKQLEHAIKRNFGGYEKVNAFDIFKLNIPQFETESQQNEEMSEKQRAVMYPDCSPLGLIRTSLKTKETTWHGENRYLLFLTENYAALQVLKRYLQEVVGLPAASSGPVGGAGGLEGPSVEDLEQQKKKKEQRKMEPFVLFGSGFPKDREYTQVCRNINQIKICMEIGRTVILLNLENLYESLYDLLNQYYIMFGGNRYVDLGLQTHRVKYRVHEDFKLILIAEKDTVYKKFPIPLINRLEKHFVLTRTVLLSWQERVLDTLVKWVQQFSRVGRFTEKDSFVGYQNDTPASVVFQATEQLREEQDWNVDEAMEESEEWLDMVMERSKNLLIQMASPDALIRLQSVNVPEIEESKKNITSTYTDQCHTSIKDFLCHHLQLHHEMEEEEEEGGFLLHVTTHSHLLSTTEMDALCHELEFSHDQIKWFLLQEFDTEMDFSNKIKLSFERRSREDSLLIVQCDSGHLYGDLIACARYRVEDEREKSSSRWSADYGRTHVLFIIHLPRRGGDGDDALGSFVGFQGGKWLSAHIDDLRVPSEAALSLEDALQFSNLFYCEGAVQSIEENLEEEEEEVEESRVEEEGRITIATSSSKRESYQCFRLYSCIQAAVARAVDSDKSKQWAIRRVNILLDLIPQQPTFPLINDELLFYAGLVKHIHSVLKEREEVVGEETGWVLNEATSRRKLQSGGTFRNVLSRKLDKVIIPIFAEVLVSVDRYSNLDLVRKNSPPHIRQLWLSAFPVLCKFSYADMTTQGGNGLAGMGQRRSMGSEFRCQFPFFWLVKETVDSHWDNAISVTGGHRQQVHQYLCEQLAGTDIREVLESVNEKVWKDLYQRYLRDYIRCVHQVTHKQGAMEYLLIEAALDAIITSPDLSPPNSPHPPLLSRVAAVHTAYQHYQRELLWFGCFTSHLPGVLILLQDITHNPDRLELHLQAVRMVLDDDLIPPLTAKTKKNLPRWLVWMQLCQNAIDSILTLGQETELATKLYAQWQRVRAVQMFAEHIITKCYYLGLETFGKKLDFGLENGCDFTKDGTVAIVQKTLQAMEGELEKKKLDKQTMTSIRESCRSFFMELVSTLCFGQTTLPEPELIKRLMNIVFKDNEKTKDFTYSDKVAADKQPVIRSFLLQLLLEHDTERVRVHLEEYFERSQSCQIVEVNHLSMLCIQCFEDALFKQHTQYTLQQRINHSLQLLKDGSEGMVSHSFPTLPYLEAVAKLRYSLSVVAELLHTQLTAGRGEGGHCHTHDAHLLIEETKQCCSIPQLNQEEAGPGVYLVKLQMRRYGPSFLSTLTSDPALQWVVPEHLRQSDDKESQRMDRFVIYDPHYPQLRTALLDAAYGQQMDGLKESCQALTPNESVPVLLAVYEVVTQSHSYRQQSKHIDNEVVGEISSFTKNLTMLNRELKCTAEALIRNTQGGRLDALCCQPGHSPHNTLLSAVVVHTAIAIYSRSTLDIMLPLFNMVEKPGDLQQAYLPTMPQDERRILGGSFYECARGHPYFISECGRPWVESTCPTCGSGIGGISHTLKSDNKVARQNDTTQTGYALGPPEQRETIPSPERSLSPAACAILRAIMHSALLWATCNNENAMEGLLQLTHVAVRPPDMAGFFWRHLEHDITILRQAVGKSEDDVCLLLHLILKNMATKTPASSSGMQTYASLLATNAREQWEKCFEQEYIQPVLASLDKQMGDAMNLIVNDKKEDRDRLFYTVYEMSSLPSSSLLPHLWTYRSRITLEHLFQTLQAQKMKDTCPILHKFLKEEPILRATRYLPELVQLQKQMFDFSHRRLDRKEATKLPVRDYIKSLKNEHKRNQFREQLKCVRIVWELVKDKLSAYARVRVPENYLGMVISEELKVEWFIPTLTGPGVVTVAMLDLLVGAHNDFIEKSRAVLKKGQKTDMSWKDQKFPVPDVQLCHLLDYEHQLLSIVLSHCHYSLRHGHGQDIRYDLPALEKHIVDRFIHGKPLLMLEIPQVVYRRDVYTATSFANIRKKVSPQIKLSLREQQDIVAELKTVQKIRDCLDVVEIVMRFLASGGQKADDRLDNYLETALKMKHRFNCKKALEYCCLGHVLSLWETLSVELAKQFTLTDQEPFDSLHDNYLVELGDKEKELNGVLAKCDLPVLLCTLYEFIETNVRHREPREHDWGLVDTLEAHLDQYSLPQLPDLHQLPADITIGQAVSTWKHIVIYQLKKKTNTTQHLY